MEIVIGAGVVLLVLVVLVVWLRGRGKQATAAWAENAVQGEALVTEVHEQWRTGNSNDDKLGREYDVRLTVDVTVTAPGVGTRRRFDVSVTNKDAPKVTAGARFRCEVLPSDLAVIQVYVRDNGPKERFENGREVSATP